jgi:hypothetical protein
MAEPDIRKREARLAARESRLVRRERDLASREAELADDDGSAMALGALLEPPRVALRVRVAVLAQIALGLWLMVAPLVLGYERSGSRSAAVACGAALAALGLWRLAGSATTTAAAPWLSVGAATILIAIASLAERGAVAAANDALVGIAAWVAVIAATPGQSGP